MKKLNKKNIKKVVKKNCEKSAEKVYKSISEINFDLIPQNKSFEDILQVVKKYFPESKYQKTHYYWYRQRIKNQRELGLDLTHLKFTTAKIYDLKNEKNNKKVTKKIKK